MSITFLWKKCSYSYLLHCVIMFTQVVEDNNIVKNAKCYSTGVGLSINTHMQRITLANNLENGTSVKNFYEDNLMSLQM